MLPLFSPFVGKLLEGLVSCLFFLVSTHTPDHELWHLLPWLTEGLCLCSLMTSSSLNSGRLSICLLPNLLAALGALLFTPSSTKHSAFVSHGTTWFSGFHSPSAHPLRSHNVHPITLPWAILTPAFSLALPCFTPTSSIYEAFVSWIYHACYGLLDLSDTLPPPQPLSHADS